MVTPAPLAEVPQPVNQITKVSSQTWQKVTFAKKRPLVPQTNSSGVASQNSLQNGSDGNQTMHSNGQVKNLTSKILERTRAASQQKTESIQMIYPANPAPKIFNRNIKRAQSQVGPLPVFDCLYCCQEHFVLFKTNENILTNKYKQKKYHDLQMQLCLLDMALSKKYDFVNNENLKQEIADFKIESLKINFIKLKSITSKAINFQKPILKRTFVLKKKQNKVEQQTAQEVKPVTSPQPPQYNLCDILSQSVNESIFCVNLRTRRQKILQNISFESETHNIYDPYFTSDDDSDSESESSEESEEEEEEEEESAQNQSSCSDEEQDSEIQSGELTDNSISTIEKDDDDQDLSSVEDERDDLPTPQQPNLKVVSNDENEEDDDNSERLTFGCITPQDEEDQKVTFSNYGEEPSLSPVRSNKNLTQERIDQISPNQLKNVLLLDHGPLSCEDKNKRIVCNSIMTKQQCQNTPIHNNLIIKSYPEIETPFLQQQQSYDTDIKIGQILSQISRPTEESKERSTPSNSSQTDNENQTVTSNQLSHVNVLQAINFYPSSKSFNQGAKYSHQKLITKQNFNHLEQRMPSSKQIIKNIQMDMLKVDNNKDKFNEMLKRTQMLKDKQMKYINNQHFMSFDQASSNQVTTQSKKDLSRQQTDLTHSKHSIYQFLITNDTQDNKTFDDTILTARHAAAKRVAVSTFLPTNANNDFSQMSDIQKFKKKISKFKKSKQSSSSNKRSAKNLTITSSSSKKLLGHTHKNSNVPKFDLQEGTVKRSGFSKNNKLMISQKEFNQFKTALCSGRYSTQAQHAINALYTYNLEDEMKTNKSVKTNKKQSHHKKQHSKTNLDQQKSNEKGVKNKQSNTRQKSSKNGKQEAMIMMQMAKQATGVSKHKQELITNYIQPDWYTPIQQTVPSNLNTQQLLQKNNLYMSIQEGKYFLPSSQHDTINTEQSTMLPNSLSKISYKRKPEKLNGSIEEVHNILNSIDFKSHCSNKDSVSLSRGAANKNISNSITRHTNDIAHIPGQFSFIQNSVKLNLTANLSKSSQGTNATIHKKKKSKLPPQVTTVHANTTTSSSTVKSGFAKQNRQRTRSSSKQSLHQTSHQLLMTQQINDNKQIGIKSNQKIISETVKQNKKDDTITIKPEKASNSHISSRKQNLMQNNSKPQYGSSLFMLSQTTSPMKIENNLNFCNGMMRISQKPVPMNPSLSVKESIDLKKSLSNDYYEYLNARKTNKQQ